jgi:hypothetical protein
MVQYSRLGEICGKSEKGRRYISFTPPVFCGKYLLSEVGYVTAGHYGWLLAQNAIDRSTLRLDSPCIYEKSRSTHNTVLMLGLLCKPRALPIKYEVPTGIPSILFQSPCQSHELEWEINAGDIASIAGM